MDHGSTHHLVALFGSINFSDRHESSAVFSTPHDHWWHYITLVPLLKLRQHSAGTSLMPDWSVQGLVEILPRLGRAAWVRVQSE